MHTLIRQTVVVVLSLSIEHATNRLRGRKSSLYLTKFSVNSIYIYGSKSVYYKNTFHN
jgi:hypothetical protein